MADTSIQFGLSTLLTVSTIELIIGALVGRFFRPRIAEVTGEDPETLRLRAAQQQQSELLDEMMARVSQLTGNIGKDVGAHSTRVQQIGHDLQLASKTPEVDLNTALMGAMSSVTEANEQLQKQLHDAEQKLIDQAYELQVQVAIARTDKLTGLLNRRACDDALAQRMGEFQRYGVSFTLLLIDIDRFKRFNDTHGHQAGDEVLRGVAQALVHSMRDVDIVCRYGGEEFAILMPATDLGGAGIAAERTRQQVEDAIIEFGGKQLQVTFSGGVTNVFPGETVAELIGRADKALYAAKNAGRNCVFLHDGSSCIRLTTTGAPQEPSEVQPQPIDPPAPEAPAFELPQEPVDLERFTELLQSAIENHQQTGTETLMVLGCVDQLSEIDHREGGFAVDLALRAAVQVLRAALTDSESVTRTAADQVGLVLNAMSPAHTQTIVERARMAIEKCRLALPSKQLLNFTMSFAVVEVLPGDDAGICLARGADTLTLAVAAGGNQTKLAPMDQPAVISAA